MKFVVIGSGGREHAICQSLKKSRKVSKIYCLPGNGGTKSIAENIDIDTSDFEKIKNFILKNNVDIALIGPEEPLVNGIVDYLNSYNIRVFGPNKIASQLEGSKIFTKNLCKKYKIPTADFGVFKNKKDSLSFLNNCKHPIVIKSDALAAGKGVYICENIQQSHSAVKEIFDGKFGEAKQILIEEFLKGEEMSFFIISDGKCFKKFGTAQDHKRVSEGDIGKNTGGMGAYSPSRLDSELLDQKIIDKIIKPTIKALNNFKSKFEGFLYAGLMVIDNEPYLIEYNVRMGDPECQTILPKLKSDFGELVIACVDKKLENYKIEWLKDKSLCVVLCSKGYPDKYKKFEEIKNLEKINLKQNEFIFHAGTKQNNNQLLSNGGRVLNFVIISKDFLESRDRAHKLIEKLDWKSGFYRKDIGYKVIDQ